MAETLSYDDLIDRAMDHQAAGRLDAAEALYRQVLADEPDDPDALNLLGLLLQDRRQHAESLALLKRAIAVEPDFPEALTNLARVLLTLGDRDESVEAARRAIALDPDLAEAYLQLGRGLFEQKKFAEAETSLRRSVSLAPESPSGHFHLGIVCTKLDKTGDAVAELTQAISLQPRSPLFHSALGEALAAAKRPEEALEAHRQAVALGPNIAATHAALAATQRLLFDPAASVDSCRRALELAPNHADVWVLLGANLASLGHFTEAIECQRKALALNPDSTEARQQLANLERHGGDAEVTTRLHATMMDERTSDAERTVAGFALGVMLEKAGDYANAFQAFATANALAKARIDQTSQPFDAAEIQGAVDWLIQTFQPGLFDDIGEIGSPSEAPVFIVGMPRTGTTLVEQIAASHASVHGAGERKDMLELVSRLNGGDNTTDPRTWDRDEARRGADAQIQRLKELGGEAIRVIDKLPDNILMLGHIALLFPKARIIVCRRDPRDVCLSAWCQHFGDVMDWTYSLTDCAARDREIERLTDHWLQVLPLRTLEVRYETLVGDFEGQARRLIDFLGLDWDPACLSFHETDRAVMTASYWQVRQPLYTGSVGKWRHYRPWLAPMLLALLGVAPEPAEEDWADMVADPEVAFGEATRHFRAGRFRVAKAICEALARHGRDHPDRLHLLGMIEVYLGDIPRAVERLEEAVRAQPEHLGRRVDLARALYSANRLDDAIAAAREATELDPESPDAWTQLGNAWYAKGNIEEAITALRYASELAPDSDEARFGLARVLLDGREWAEAETVWRRLYETNPDSVEVLLSLGRTLRETGHYAESLTFARRAAEHLPMPAAPLADLVKLLTMLQNLDEAIGLAEEGLRTAPGSSELWIALGEAQKYAGKFVEAGDAYRKALEHDPSSAEAFTGLIWAGQNRASDEVVERANGILADPEVPKHKRISAAFALAGAYEQDEEYDLAFDAFKRANDLVRGWRQDLNMDTSLASIRDHVELCKSLFNPDEFRRMGAVGVHSKVPTFIVGMPRSGTTLVEQIASSHPDVAGLGERSDIATLMDYVADKPRPNPLATFKAGDMRAKAAALLEHLQELAPGAQRIINKLPDNVLLLGFIAIVYPEANIILCNRDFRDVCWSCYTQSFTATGMFWTDTLEDCAERAQLTHRLIGHWRAVLPIRIHEIQYETLIADLEGESRRLIDYLGLPWDPACLEFQKNERPVMTASVWQVRQPLYSTSVGKWRNYRRHLGPMLEGLKGLVPDD